MLMYSKRGWTQAFPGSDNHSLEASAYMVNNLRCTRLRSENRWRSSWMQTGSPASREATRVFDISIPLPTREARELFVADLARFNICESLIQDLHALVNFGLGQDKRWRQL